MPYRLFSLPEAEASLILFCERHNHDNLRRYRPGGKGLLAVAAATSFIDMPRPFNDWTW
jgi:hypothetical protein